MKIFLSSVLCLIMLSVSTVFFALPLGRFEMDDIYPVTGFRVAEGLPELLDLAQFSTGTENSEFNNFIDLAIGVALDQPQYPVTDGTTIYGAAFGNPGYHWCTEFVLYCLNEADTQSSTSYIKSIYPWYDSAYECGLWYKRRSRYFEVGEYLPSKGDLIFFDFKDYGYPDHTGLVIGTIQQEGIDFILTIEGNIPTDPIPQIRLRRIALDDPTLFAFGSCFSTNNDCGQTDRY